MKDGAALVKRDDVRVGQFLFAVARGSEIRQVDGIFALASAERRYGRPVCQCALVVRNAHAGNFVRGLGQSAVVHPVKADYDLLAYEANRELIENQNLGLAKFTELKVEKIRTGALFVIRSKDDYQVFEDIVASGANKNAQGHQTFFD